MSNRSLATMVLAGCLSVSGAAQAVTLHPDGIVVSTLTGSTDTTSPYTDDVFLEGLTFSTASGDTANYNLTNGTISAARTFEITEGRSRFNAEWGDNDTNSDGDADPFTKAGFAGANQETTDPTIQDRALLNAFNSRSLSEISDGEGGGLGQFVVTFQDSLSYDDVGGDDLPDIVFFERGGNDRFQIELITGGSANNPIYSSAVSLRSNDFWNTGIQINTVEINNAQSLFVGGFDFDTFGLSTGDVVSGFRMTATDGPDFGGFFLVSENPQSFTAPVPIPLPASGLLLVAGLAALRARARR